MNKLERDHNVTTTEEFDCIIQRLKQKELEANQAVAEKRNKTQSFA